jgi:hypothetical protein
VFCGLFFGFCCFVLMGKPSNTLLINVLAIRVVFGVICEREWMCLQICANFEGPKIAFVTKNGKK